MSPLKMLIIKIYEKSQIPQISLKTSSEDFNLLLL